MIERYPATDRDAWLAMRRYDLTASDVAAALGRDPFKSALQLYAEKTGEISAQADNKMMRRGRWLESAVIAAVSDEYPEFGTITQPKVYLRDPALRLGATPDAIAGIDGGLVNIQCKVVSKPAYERDWQEGPPFAYVAQTATEGMLMDASRSIIAALVIDTYSAELFLHDVPRHEGAEERIRFIARDFWENIGTGQRPVIDYSRDIEIIEKLYPVSKEKPVIDLTGDNRLAELLPQRERAKQIIKIEQKLVEEIDTEIKAKLGHSELGTLPGWKLSWKTQTRKETVIPASTFRVLRVTNLEPKEEAA